MKALKINNMVFDVAGPIVILVSFGVPVAIMVGAIALIVVVIKLCIRAHNKRIEAMEKRIEAMGKEDNPDPMK